MMGKYFSLMFLRFEFYRVFVLFVLTRVIYCYESLYLFKNLLNSECAVASDKRQSCHALPIGQQSYIHYSIYFC